MATGVGQYIQASIGQTFNRADTIATPFSARLPQLNLCANVRKATAAHKYLSPQNTDCFPSPIMKHVTPYRAVLIINPIPDTFSLYSILCNSIQT
jgi:hypothetical protein